MTMRLLLLLSALLTALSGVTGARATAQPVQASAAAAAMIAPRAAAVSPVSLRFAVPAYDAVPPLRLAMPRPISAVASHILYAERRRE